MKILQNPPMKILQLGSGSMGTRRLRDLHKRPDITLALYDERADRRAAAQSRFGVKVFARLDEALAWGPQALIVSTPPGTKGDYITLAFERGLHHFSEADIWTYGAASRAAQNKSLVSAPSASMAFLPLVKQLGPLLRENLGRLLGYQFSMAFYMPSWHPAEGLEYYARHRNTAPSREMIPFELNWLNALFSPATEVAGRFEKFGALPGDTEDTWSMSMRLLNGGILYLSNRDTLWKELSGRRFDLVSLFDEIKFKIRAFQLANFVRSVYPHPLIPVALQKR